MNDGWRNNMQATTNLLEYINRQNNFVDINKLLKDNSLFYNIGNLVCEFVDEDYKAIDENRKIALMYEYEIVKLCRLFSNQDIHPIIFKGLLLSRILYGNIFERMCNDLDIYIQDHQFDQALKLLLNNGYQLRSEEELKRQHHVVLIKEKSIVLELHKNIYHPMIGINEDLLKKEICNWEFGKDILPSFSITGTFLHLLYHLYMDTWLYSFDMYTIFVTRSIRKAPRFLYRAYEIALFSEKYFSEIDWTKVVNDVLSQNLRVIFKIMLLDIVAIFPETFPSEILTLLLNRDYSEDQRDIFYKYLIDAEIYNGKSVNFDGELCDFINCGWNNRSSNICTTINKTIFLVKECKENIQLTCKIQVSKKSNGILLTFEVSIDDLCLSDSDKLDGQSSDGIHLLLCGTADNIFSYKSIFFFPKKVNDKYSVVVCDVLSYPYKIIEDDFVQADFELREETYVIRALLSNEYVMQNNLNSCFYMGLVVSNCSNETKRRKNQLILSEDESQWYNPIYFAKIELD